MMSDVRLDAVAVVHGRSLAICVPPLAWLSPDPLQAPDVVGWRHLRQAPRGGDNGRFHAVDGYGNPSETTSLNIGCRRFNSSSAETGANRREGRFRADVHDIGPSAIMRRACASARSGRDNCPPSKMNPA